VGQSTPKPCQGKNKPPETQKAEESKRTLPQVADKKGLNKEQHQ
jgi:hypothetical protein